MPVSRWKLKKIWKVKRQGQVWVVEDSLGNQGYFKFANKGHWYFSGPMVANEYIAAALARRLGFPTAKLKIADVVDHHGMMRRGVVSKSVKAKEVITWKEADQEIHRIPETYVKRIKLLCSLVVFDAWITNIDRAAGKNLILHRNRNRDKYDWYLIDHGHALYGSPRKWERGAWNTSIWQKIWCFYHVPKGLLQLQSSPGALEPMIRKIESLQESDIDAALQSVPRGYLRGKERSFIRKLLLSRRTQIRGIIKRWLNNRGIKEYGNE